MSISFQCVTRKDKCLFLWSAVTYHRCICLSSKHSRARWLNRIVHHSPLFLPFSVCNLLAWVVHVALVLVFVTLVVSLVGILAVGVVCGAVVVVFLLGYP